MLLNSADPTRAESMLSDVEVAARTMGHLHALPPCNSDGRFTLKKRTLFALNTSLFCATEGLYPFVLPAGGSPLAALAGPQLLEPGAIDKGLLFVGCDGVEIPYLRRAGFILIA